MNLSGKVALVTGGSRGIGRGIALSLASEGADVAVNYVSNEAAATEVVETIMKMGRRAIKVKCDVSQPDQVDEMVDKVLQEFGKIDILINNAGISRVNLLENVSVDDWRTVIETNLSSAFYCTRAVVLKSMLANSKGRIINISSISGQIGEVGDSCYAAAKAGLMGLTKALAKELVRKGIIVNCVAPGYIETDMTASITEKHRERVIKQIPLRRFGEPEDIGSIVAYLCRDDVRYIVGQVIHVNGGLYM